MFSFGINIRKILLDIVFIWIYSLLKGYFKFNLIWEKNEGFVFEIFFFYVNVVYFVGIFGFVFFGK